MNSRQHLQSNLLLSVVGATEYIIVDRRYHKIPAKIDTGAHYSSIHASAINITPAGILEFALFEPSSPFFDGQLYHFAPSDYSVRVVRSSNGTEQIRYFVKLPIALSHRRIRVTFSLADRSKNTFPILIGARTLKGKFLVDVSQSSVTALEPKPKSPAHLTEFRADPYQFHQQYFKKPAT